MGEGSEGRWGISDSYPRNLHNCSVNLVVSLRNVRWFRLVRICWTSFWFPLLFPSISLGKCSRCLLLSWSAQHCWSRSLLLRHRLSLSNSPNLVSLHDLPYAKQTRVSAADRLPSKRADPLLSALVRDPKASLPLGMNLLIKRNCAWVNTQRIIKLFLLRDSWECKPQWCQFRGGPLELLLSKHHVGILLPASITRHCQSLLDISVIMLNRNQLVSLWNSMNLGTRSVQQREEGAQGVSSFLSTGWSHLVWRCQSPESG